MSMQRPGSAPERPRSLFDRIGERLGGLGQGLGQLASGVPEGLPPELAEAARRRGLLAFGSTLLQATTPSVQPRSFLGDVGTALQASQAGALEGAQVQQQIVAERQARARQARMQQLLETDDPNVLMQMFQESVASGDVDSARAISEVLKSQRTASGGKIVTGTVDGVPQLFQVGASGELEPLVTPEGQPVAPYSKPQAPGMRQMIDPNSGQVVWAQVDPMTGEFRSTGVLAPSFPGDKERQAHFFSNFLPDEGAFEAFMETGPSRVEQFLSDKGLRELTSSEMQNLVLTGNVFAEAWLRMTTGAAYNDTEFVNAFRLFVPQAGDSKTALARKAANREHLRKGLKSAAGRAARDRAVGGYQQDLVDPSNGETVRNKLDFQADTTGRAVSRLDALGR